MSSSFTVSPSARLRGPDSASSAPAGQKPAALPPTQAEIDSQYRQDAEQAVKEVDGKVAIVRTKALALLQTKARRNDEHFDLVRECRRCLP